LWFISLFPSNINTAGPKNIKSKLNERIFTLKH
jgi:hypothetical protein